MKTTRGNRSRSMDIPLHNVTGTRASVTWGGRSRNTGFSSACAQSMFQNDTGFMDKISEALEVVYENYGATAIEDIAVLDEEKGEADIDVDLLAQMMDESKIKIRNECCSMFFYSKSIVGSFSYLFGSISFGAMTYYNFSETVDTLICFFGSSMYLIGGTMYIIAALEPWLEKTKQINRMCASIQDLRMRGKLVRQMTGQGQARSNQDASAIVKARMSKLNIDTKALFVPNERDEEMMQEEDGSDDLYSLVASDNNQRDSQCSIMAEYRNADHRDVGITINEPQSFNSAQENQSLTSVPEGSNDENHPSKRYEVVATEDIDEEKSDE